VIAWKFLAAGAVGPFTRFRWPVGEWVEAVRAEDGFGVHACRADDLAFWTAPELWQVELEGPVRVRRTQIEAPRGRLVARVAAWDAKLQAEHGLSCVFQARDVVAGALVELGCAVIAERFAGARTLEELVGATSAIEPPAGFAGEMFGYARDAAAAFSANHNAAEVSFMASVATAAARGTPAGFGEEKVRQSRWIAARVGIATLAQDSAQ
jgi:hypothetical protein